MTHIIFEHSGEQHEIALQDGESVLEGIVRSGYSVPNSCRSGVCQNCKMISEDDIPTSAKKGLKRTQQEQGYFLSCCCHPKESMVVKLAPAPKEYQATVITKQFLSDDVLILRVSKEFDYRPGQFISIKNPIGESRCYSIASHNELNHYIELHVRVIEGGAVSHWLNNDLRVSDSVTIMDALGDCFYSVEDKENPLFLCGIGTGFAPLYGILQDALFHGHKGKIHVLLGAKTGDGFYYSGLLPKLRSSQVLIHQVALNLDEKDNRSCFQADIYRYAEKFVPDFSQSQVYLCGAETFVQKMRKVCFMAGTPMQNIASDAFIQAK